MSHAKDTSYRREKIISGLYWAVFILLLVAMFGYVFWEIFRPLAGTRVTIQGREHIPETEHPTYNSNPPTSGPHYADTEEWGIYEKPLVTEKLVHNLEHGGIIYMYNCENCDELVKKLREVANRVMKKDRKVIVVPYPQLDAKIAAVAWGWYDKMEEVDEERLIRFFQDHVNRGPEKVF